MGVASSSEYPELEKITQKKLDLMDEFIRDKSALAAQTSKSSSKKSNKPEDEEKKTEEIKEIQYGFKSIKALLAPNQETKKDIQEVVSRQKSELGGGFGTLLLDGMYQHGAVKAAFKASTAYASSGS